jgi:hypothetical protein
MLSTTTHRQLLATVATAAAFAATAPAASAVPVDNGRTVPVKVVRVQVDEGMDWGDAGIGAAGMLAAVLLGYGGMEALTSVSRRKRSLAHS